MFNRWFRWTGMLILATVDAATAHARWYSEQVAQHGRALYAQHCATCHGAQGQGAANWRQANADDTLPPPPLNGTGHTWHHPLRVLVRQVKDGGTPVGGSMPAFGYRLDTRQILTVIAYLQSWWPNDIYAAWLERGGLPDSLKRKNLTNSDGG